MSRVSYFRAALLGAAASLTASAALAEPTQVAEIIVSANKVPTAQERVGSSVSVIDSAEIERRQQVQALDLLKRVPGVSISRNGGLGSTSTVRLRGSESGMVKVLIDGVEVNDASGANNEFDFNSLLTGDIEKIEVLKGPQSALYGNDAMGGVINVITRRGEGETKIRGTLEGGAYGSFRQLASLTGGTQQVDYALSAANLHTDGFSRTFAGNEKDGTDARSVSGRLGVKASDILRFDLNAAWSWLDTEFDPFGADGASAQEKESWQVRGAGTLSLLDGTFENVLAASYATTDRDFDEPTGFYRFSTFDSRRKALDYQGNLRLREADIASIGLSVDEEDGKTTNTVGTSTSTGLDDSVTTKSAFVQYQAAITSDLTLTLGGRVDDHEQFGTEGTWRATGAYQVPATGTVLRASYGTANKAPTLYQLYDPFYGNKNLVAEDGKGADIGFDQKLLDGRVGFGASLFRNSYTNMIGFSNGYINVARARTKGVELTFEANPVETVLIQANYTYLDAKDRITGRDLPRRPQDTVNASIDWTIVEGIDLGAALRYVGKQRDTASATSPILDSYTTVDFTARWAVLDNVSLFGRVENLFDEDYQEVRTYRAPGRSAFGGVTVTF
ncbi:MAG: TonB-dependent receptor plug domain-containing protein [Niveispirillum sp.]|uniref:TonB-dependent receptor plug domain-containing protein n=1 Tax=Niveispirillum sp. TaxID=1917217 RepID=UPI003BA58BA4